MAAPASCSDDGGAADGGTGSMLWEKAVALRRRAWESGLTCAFFASVIFSLSAMQVKLTGGRVPVLELCLIRSSISFCTSVTVGTASRIKPLFGHRQRLPLLFLRGLFGTAAISCSYVSILNLPLGDSATLSQLRPPAMAIMGHLLLGEHMGWLGAVGCLISLAGATIVSHPPFLFGGHTDWGHHRLLGTLCGIASPLCGAGAGYCIRRIQRQEPALVVALWFHTVTISLLVWPLLAGWPQAAVVVTAKDAALLLGISCSSFCAQLLMTRAFQLLPAARASALSFLGVIYAHGWGALIFGEKLTAFTAAGGLLIFAGVLLVTLTAHVCGGGGGSSGSRGGKAGGARTGESSNINGTNGNSTNGTTTANSGSNSQDDPEAAVPLKGAQYDEQQQQQHDTAPQSDQTGAALTSPSLPAPGNKAERGSGINSSSTGNGGGGGHVVEVQLLPVTSAGAGSSMQQQPEAIRLVDVEGHDGAAQQGAASSDSAFAQQQPPGDGGSSKGQSHADVSLQVLPPLPLLLPPLPPPHQQQQQQQQLGGHHQALPAPTAAAAVSAAPARTDDTASSTTSSSGRPPVVINSSSSITFAALTSADSIDGDEQQLQRPLLLSHSSSSCSSGLLTPLGSFTQGR